MIRLLIKKIHSMLPHILRSNSQLTEIYPILLWYAIVPLVTPSLSWEIPEDIRDKFDEYVKTEEVRLADNLEHIKYAIDDPNTVSIVTGYERLEKVCAGRSCWYSGS